MSAPEDVDDANADENILYDLTIHAEWKQESEVFSRTVNKEKHHAPILGRLTSSTQRAAWTFLRTFGLPLQKASPCSLPVGLVKLVGCQINWHIAVSRDAKLVGILQEQNIEIRSNRDDYSTIIGRAGIHRDPYPQWRHLVWSPDSTMLACSHSCGTVEAYDIVGSLLFTISNNELSPHSKLPVDLSCAVAALVFTDTKPENWSAELLVVNYHGSLRSYKVDRDQGFSLQHSFLFNQHYPRGISSLICHPGAGILYVGGCGLDQEAGSASLQQGLTAWRVLSDYPHYKLVTNLTEDGHKLHRQRSLVSRIRLPKFSYLKGDSHDGIFKLSLSPSGKYIAAIHHSGKFSVWSAPGLKPLASWQHSEQEGCDDISPEFTENPQLRKQLKDLVSSKNLIDVNWWSNEAVILARCTGALTVSSIKTLKNLLGTSPEWFEPSPRLTGVIDGGFLGLEVETRSATKRRLGAIEAADEDSDEDDYSMVAKTTQYTKHVLQLFSDSERFQPRKKKPKLVNRTYRLVCLKSTTPEELFQRKIENEEYGEARALARAYNLDCDLVYQRQWHKSPVSIAAIQDYLSKISKRSWVLHECQVRMSESIDAMKELMEFGLRGTDIEALIMIGKGEDKGRFVLCDPEEGLYEGVEIDQFDPDADEKRHELLMKKQQELLEQVDFDNLTLEQMELCRVRQKLQQYLYRLKTYECILGGVNYAAERYDLKFFEKFRSDNMVETAVKYAQSSDWKALDILFTYHSEELTPHRLAILSNFPETTSPSEFRSLLPETGEDNEVLPWSADRWRDPDWVEVDPCKSATDLDQTDLGEFLYEAQPDLLPYRGDLSPAVLSEWYKYRAFEIERHSRQVDYSVELIKMGMERGVQELDLILDDLVTMELLVYDCHIDDTLTFQQLQQLADYDKLEMIMKQSSEDMYSKNLHKWMVPFLKQCERKTPDSYDSLLRDYLVTLSRSDLTRPLKVFEASKSHLATPVIRSQPEMMSAALECLYTCDRDDQLHLAMEILKCLPQKGYGTLTPESKELHLSVDRLEHHLGASRILEENGIKRPIYFIRDTEASADNAQKLFTKLTRMAGHKDPPMNEVHWTKLHTDIMQLQDKVYRCLSKPLCHEIFVEALLCSSHKSNIQLAGKLIERSVEESQKPSPQQFNMQTRVPYDRAVELVLSAAREYFNSSANLTDPCMTLARSCLNLIQDTPAVVQEENDLISSLSILEDFGVTVLPLQVRLSKDRLELVRKSVHSKPTAYKNKQKFLRLGHLLRIPADCQKDRDGKVLHIVAASALQAKDFTLAFDLCDQLMAWGHGPAWDVCVDLAEHEDFQNVPAKVELLSFAVTFCTPEMIEPVLQARALLETQVLFEKISSNVEAGKGDNRRLSPFSAKAALQQTQQILTSTKQTTKAVLSTVTDSKWWNSTVHRLKQPTSRQVSQDFSNRNSNLDKQGCHPFYAGNIDNAVSNTPEADFTSDQVEVDPAVDISESLLRTAQLEEILTEGEKSQPATEVLLQLAGEAFPVDSTLSLAYLLALQQPTDADRCFEEHPRTDISIQLALYYYALQIYAAVKPDTGIKLNSLYTHPPARVMQKVTQFVTQKTDCNWPEEVLSLVTKMKHYDEMLQDYRQAKVLKGLGRGIDIGRFTDDSEYKEETILGLAMSVEENLYSISVSLAERYEIPLWKVYAAHLEFLFSDSGWTTSEISGRVTKLNILPTLRSQPVEFCERMTSYVYLTLVGTDHEMLVYYYTTLTGCDQPLEGGMTADAHVKLLKKIKPIAPDLDYKQLLNSDDGAMATLSPCLTTSNINTLAKLANRLPDGAGGYLEPSAIFCMWAVKFFWDEERKQIQDSSSAWVHRYEACQEYIQKFQPGDVISFIQAVVFTEKARQRLGTDCRQEIVRRILKLCRQFTSGKKKRQQQEDGRSGEMTWDRVLLAVQGYGKHLETLTQPVITSMAQSQSEAVQRYAQQYDLSAGSIDKVHELFTCIVLDGTQPFDMVQNLLTVVPTETWTLATVVKEAFALLLLKLRNSETVPSVLEKVDCLSALEHIVCGVQEHVETGGDRVTAEDVLAELRPFCSDVSVDVQPRLDVLYVLEKSFKLSEEDSLLLILYRTQAVVLATWPQCQITENEVKTTTDRQTLYSELLSRSSSRDEFSSMCRLLKVWPPFPGQSSKSAENNHWVGVFTAMVESGDKETISDIIATVQEIQTTSPLPKQGCGAVFTSMIQASAVVEAVKFALVVSCEELFPTAVEHLCKVPQVNPDDLLFDLIFKHKLVTSLVASEHYPLLIQFLLANSGAESPDYMSVDDVANQLRESGFEAEAGSLILQARTTHPLLQTFGAAIGVLGKWLKK